MWSNWLSALYLLMAWCSWSIADLSSVRTEITIKCYYDDVIMTMSLKSPASRLFTEPFIQTQIKENIKAPRHWPLCGEFTGTSEFPAQRASYAENVSIWWRHHGLWKLHFKNFKTQINLKITLLKMFTGLLRPNEWRAERDKNAVTVCLVFFCGFSSLWLQGEDPVSHISQRQGGELAHAVKSLI